MAISLTAFAQTNVKGVVTDKNGEAVTGAIVLNKDNGKWAVTDVVPERLSSKVRRKARILKSPVWATWTLLSVTRERPL